MASLERRLWMSSAVRSRWRARMRLQRPKTNVPELDRPGTVLKGDVALRMLGVVDVHHLHPVDQHGHLRALGGDVDRVPLAAGHDDARRLRDVDDRAGAIRL